MEKKSSLKEKSLNKTPNATHNRNEPSTATSIHVVKQNKGKVRKEFEIFVLMSLTVSGSSSAKATRRNGADLVVADAAALQRRRRPTGPAGLAVDAGAAMPHRRR